jgi:hypothetical protein
MMNCVFVVPTGIGCSIGGHAGDATPAAKLIASVCDNLFIHPNVVNASDINEMTDNMLYVEGSMLDRFLSGGIGLKKVSMNKILLVTNPPVKNETINAVNAARTTIGADIEIFELKEPLLMNGYTNNNRAEGSIENFNEMIWQVRDYDFDVLVVHTPITVKDKEVKKYLESDGGINPWGGVEALLSRKASWELNKPVFHAPIENNEVFKKFTEVVDPRKAAELVSVCYLHCCLKGGHKAPKMMNTIGGSDFWNHDIDFLITPFGIWGRPHELCQNHGIPVIAVRENTTASYSAMPAGVILASNYLQVAGIISAKKAGVTLSSVLGRVGNVVIHGKREKNER